jgi:hypothetical protein
LADALQTLRCLVERAHSAAVIDDESLPDVG